MNITKTMLALVGAALMTAGAFADEPTVTLTRFQQRYPWNGLVDIDYTVENVGNPEDYYVKFTVSNNVAKTSFILDNFEDDSTIAVASNGLYRATWRSGAMPVEKFLSKDVTVRADLVFDPGCNGARTPYRMFKYLTIDLTEGPTATSYPVTTEYFTDQEVANAKFNTDEYKKDKLVLRRVLRGQFKMGSPVGEYGREATGYVNRETEHEVRLTQDFLLGVFEVTQAQYYRVMGENPSTNNKNNDGLYPVNTVTYQTIRGSSAGCQVPPTFGNVAPDSFLGKLSERTGLQFDLPTEAQWEYACRAGTTTMTYAGDFTTTPNEVVNSIAWYAKNSGKETHVVGGKLPNGWGFYDMIGNVWEWARDRVKAAKNDNFGYEVTETNIPLQINPLGSVDANASFRGASCCNDADCERAACREGDYTVTMSHYSIGFRLSSTLP